MNRYEYKQLKVTELLLNPGNPRFDPVHYQTEAILSMVKDQGEKLVELAKHIADYGLSPTEIILVQPLEKQWLVREGNRRITAIKLVNEPELVPDGYPKIKREFQRLNAVFDNDIIDSILCVAITDDEVANEWIRLKHTGENRGIGTVGWDAQQISRFNAHVSGKVDPRMAFLDKLRGYAEIPQEYKDKFSSIKKTNFDRLMGDPDVRKLLGISAENGEYILVSGVNGFLLEVLKDLIISDLSVAAIYHKQDRFKYIDDLKIRFGGHTKIVATKDLTKDSVAPCESMLDDSVDSAGQSPQAEAPHNSGDVIDGPLGPSGGNYIPSPTAIAQNNGNNRGKSYPIYRKALIPSHHKLTITHARILKIFNELKALDCDQYPNAASVLFRVFIELGADCYIASHSISGVNVDKQLSQKIEAIANYFELNSIMTKHDLRAIRQMISSQTQNNSVKTFHSYVHNKDITPISSDIRSAWDDVWPFVENLWR